MFVSFYFVPFTKPNIHYYGILIYWNLANIYYPNWGSIFAALPIVSPN